MHRGVDNGRGGLEFVMLTSAGMCARRSKGGGVSWRCTQMNEGRSENGLLLLGNARKRMAGGRDNLSYAETVSRWRNEKGKGESESPAGDVPRGVGCEMGLVSRLKAENEW